MEGVVAIFAMAYLAFAVVAFIMAWAIAAYAVVLAILLVFALIKAGFHLFRWLI